jgi:hypothetical protein
MVWARRCSSGTSESVRLRPAAEPSLRRFATLHRVEQTQVWRSDPGQQDLGINVATLMPDDHPVPSRVGRFMCRRASSSADPGPGFDGRGARSDFCPGPAASVVDGGAPKADACERVQHPGRVRRAGAHHGGIATAERVRPRPCHRRAGAWVERRSIWAEPFPTCPGPRPAAGSWSSRPGDAVARGALVQRVHRELPGPCVCSDSEL